MYFSPSSDCGRIRHEASWRKSWKPGSVIFITTTALPGLAGARRGAVMHDWLALAGIVTSTESTLPDVGAGDPHLLARDQEVAVVEDRPDLVAAARAAGRLAEEDAARRRPGAPMIASDPPHGPGGTSEVSHFGFGGWPPVSRLPSSVNGLEPAIGLGRAARAAGEGPERRGR